MVALSRIATSHHRPCNHTNSVGAVHAKSLSVLGYVALADSPAIIVVGRRSRSTRNDSHFEVRELDSLQIVGIRLLSSVRELRLKDLRSGSHDAYIELGTVICGASEWFARF